MSEKIAVVLFNLGGPDQLTSVKPFLRNLFRDKAIIRLPGVLRHPLAWLIASRRETKARSVYERLGGGSPIIEHTRQQAAALEEALGGNARVFFSMRYWHPMSAQVAREVKKFNPDKVLLLPLYPQYSTTTTESSLADWKKAARRAGISAEVAGFCCYPTQPLFIGAHATLIREAYWKAAESGKPRVLFSAHGLPQKIIDQGDPYAWQVEQTVTSIVRLLGVEQLDYAICYQSRVGPLQWIGPSTQEEIRRAGRDGVPVVLSPVAFVSEHSETLVELDMEYRALAEELGVPAYVRVPALGTNPHFIGALKSLCSELKNMEGICGPMHGRICPRHFAGCGHGKIFKEAV